MPFGPLPQVQRRARASGVAGRAVPREDGFADLAAESADLEVARGLAILARLNAS